MTNNARLAAIHSLDHFALRVPDLALAASFYEALGLSVARVGEVLTLKCSGSGHVWARVVQGASKGLAWLSFGCADTDYRGLLRQLEAAGAQRQDGPREAESGGSWYADPDGNLLQIKVGPKVSPSSRQVAQPLMPDRLRGVEGGRKAAPRVRPVRLSHVMLFSHDVPRQSAFYCDTLGLGVADTSLDLLSFLYGKQGSDHHILAFAKSARRGFHHAAWVVPSMEECGLGSRQMADAGYVHGWGVGRHGVGSNHFYYVRDPWGSYCEYTADLDFIASGAAWASAQHDPLEALCFWGPDLPETFLLNGEGIGSS
jgi:catechol 2,3-dioxygenase-like lactoylglutathione lyase family enzyme